MSTGSGQWAIMSRHWIGCQWIAHFTSSRVPFQPRLAKTSLSMACTVLLPPHGPPVSTTRFTVAERVVASKADESAALVVVIASHLFTK